MSRLSKCTKTPGVHCVRVSGHAGVCSACPSSATLDWDRGRQAADVLRDLDFETPYWADLND